MTMTAAAICCLMACAAPSGYRIDGKVTLPTLEGRTVYMLDALDGSIRLDSANVSGGKFSFTGSQAEPVIRELWVQQNDSDKYPITLPVVLENGRIEVDLGERVYTGGTALNKELMEVLMAIDGFYAQDLSGCSAEELKQALATLVMEQVVKNAGTVVGRYVFDRYRDVLSAAQQDEAARLFP